jgi:hypothetical protein
VWVKSYKRLPELTAVCRDTAARAVNLTSFSLTDEPGKDSYPISGVIYAECSSVQPVGKGKQVVDFLRWAVHDV